MERPATNRATIGEERATVPTIWTNAVGAVRLAATWLAQICYAKILRAIENGRPALEIELLTRQNVLIRSMTSALR
ncbi:hypothetical protein ASG11_02900 [Sphingomonas sp. Leaf357]|nr:hypothetical protein ASG11_02900 [Sphingomonas sp. Leaf357]